MREIRIFHLKKNTNNNAVEASALITAIENDILKANTSISFSQIKFIEELNCHLTFHISENDEGITTYDKKNFNCYLTVAAYTQMIDLIQPFCQPGTEGYQWLYDLDCETDLLFSPKGTW